ncbi:hypothetical protein [Gracilibacillus thailandensis]|uniref:Uncharacterized protein n=1 Tax=Gracilibacillus thailandensis TaxID=563735 RepID=A0A6N7R0R6_9BACI|nr:hypothetical protein [Gracilibacillus thailandensis]MRI65829.1 hypothetical protein [Gracilibacillus thailandensis]
MELRLLVRRDIDDYHINISQYSSLFVNYTTDERSLIQPLIEYFQPKSKVKNELRILDIDNDYEELSTSRYHAITFTNDALLEETKLGSKSLLKGQVKHSFLNNVEADGYINNINVLLEDLVEQSISELPVRPKLLTYDSIIKLLEIDLGLNMLNETNQFMHQNKLLLPILNRYLLNNLKQPGIVFFFYPETYLSPREQKEMYELLQIFSKTIPVFVITKSKQFLTREMSGMNYFIQSKQIFSSNFIEELEWNSPVNFDYSALQQSIMSILYRYADVFELKPELSNFEDAEVVLFRSIDLYVFSSLMYKMKYKFSLNLDGNQMYKPVYEYIMELYEKV